jgi:hypothetical protein
MPGWLWAVANKAHGVQAYNFTPRRIRRGLKTNLHRRLHNTLNTMSIRVVIDFMKLQTADRILKYAENPVL